MAFMALQYIRGLVICVCKLGMGTMGGYRGFPDVAERLAVPTHSREATGCRVQRSLVPAKCIGCYHPKDFGFFAISPC